MVGIWPIDLTCSDSGRSATSLGNSTCWRTNCIGAMASSTLRLRDLEALDAVADHLLRDRLVEGGVAISVLLPAWRHPDSPNIRASGNDDFLD